LVPRHRAVYTGAVGYQRIAILICALALLAGACGGYSTKASVLPKGEGGVYIALGDSIAFGENASDPERSDYVAQVFAALQQRYGDSLRLESLAAGGHATQDLIDQQLQPAIDLIGKGDVRVVTITIGGNDLYVLADNPTCPTAPQSPDCPFDEILSATQARLETILHELRTAGPNVAIAIQVYPNLFSGSGHAFEGPATYSFGRLNDAIEAVAGRNDVLVADPRAEFAGRSRELTGTFDTPANFHPNDAGYAIIAAAFLNVLGLQTP
jgi:lysophospholipase L1-like esterase